MAEYPFREIDKKWQKYWEDNKTFKTSENQEKPKYYALDMFPYPSGTGLHVGHPLGYIATDIVSRYKRLKGFNVLHPMGFDSFGLPAELYAIKTGQHPADTTDHNIKHFKEQMEVLGFSYDWDKEVRTSDPSYFKWSQWIFLKLFEKGLAYEADALINWCPNDRTVLANEEVKNGMCDRCGNPVIRRKMRQWILKITEYADRLLDDLDGLDWPESIKLSQINWIGKSHGAELNFKEKSTGENVTVYTTRPDTIYGATYMVLAPEHTLVGKITTEEQKAAIDNYILEASKKSDLERAELYKTKTGVFTGAYAINPVNGAEIPIWISDYVLISYGTGAIMAVPGGDERDFKFAKKFDLPIIQVVTPDGKEIPNQIEAYSGHGLMLNSGEYDGMDSKEFTKTIIKRFEEEGVGKGAINYKLRDWIFTRQRYWGEPIPIIHCDGCGVVPVPYDQLPITLPEVESYSPTEEGDSPLAKVEEWVNTTCPKCGKAAKRETNTMPQWAGSCWYYLRYIDPKNDKVFVDKEKEKYWMNVDLYIGGAEHAVLHLLYARFWHKVLFDLGYVSTKEPFQKLVNQGMIQGRSNFIYRLLPHVFSTSNDRSLDPRLIPPIYVSKEIFDAYKKDKFGTNEGFLNHVEGVLNEISDQLKRKNDLTSGKIRISGFQTLHVDIKFVDNDFLDIKRLQMEETPFKDAAFITRPESQDYLCGWEVEKMSKSKYNVVNPDEIVEKYGADTMRMYEMFLGPLEQFKPWNTQGIDGVFKLLRRFWNLFHDENENFNVSEVEPSNEELKVLHKTIKKAEYDVENLSFNTPVSAFMICVNELMALKCNKRQILEPLTLIVSPYAPHICEELWSKLGHTDSISYESFPDHNEEYIQEDSYEYPISVNGKMRLKMTFELYMPVADIEKEVLASEVIQKWLEGKTPKKVIIIPKKIVNIVI